MSTVHHILVTGCAGFIGFHVTKRLLEDGYPVIGIDNLNSYYDVSLKNARLNLLHQHPSFTFYRASVEDTRSIDKIFSKVPISKVVHLAAQAGVRYSIQNPHTYINSNIVGFLNILESCRRNQIEHLIYASSSSVYGANTQMPFSVHHNVDHPVSLYAATKKADELMAHSYSYLYGLPTTGLRFFTVYGPWGRPDMALFLFTKAILAGEPIQVFNHGKMERDFTYIDDIVEGIVRLIHKNPEPNPQWSGMSPDPGSSTAPYKIYNIGNHQPVELMHFISILEDKLGRKAVKEFMPLQAGDVPATYADVDDLMRDVGFQPRTGIEEGIEKFVDWYKQYYATRRAQRNIAVVGLGYVGLPVAVAFGQKQPVVGFDIDENRVRTLQQHIDSTGEVSTEELITAQVDYSTDAQKLNQSDFIIVAVPTPIDQAKQPDLIPLIKASETVGENIRKGTIVVYESTVYPGTTKEVCIPILEKYSDLKAGEDFFVGYSPERINPGDKEHTFKNIVKVVSGQDEKTLDIIAEVYGMVIDAGIYRAPSIEVAEAAKVIENTQRDLNIALMNELAIIFNRLGIDTAEVLKAAGSKWNFLGFTPGLVGGHCIGVDPYYLTYKAESTGYHPQVILAGRRINDNMGQYVATSLIKQMILQGMPIQGSRVTVLGLTFKENVPDIRNTKVVDIVQELQEFGIQVQVTDPLADPIFTETEYGLKLLPMDQLESADAVIVAVPHDAFIELGWTGLTSLLSDHRGIVVDVKSVLDTNSVPETVTLWRL